MKKLILISCVSKKLQFKSKAKDLYISSLIKYNMKYAKTLQPDVIYILSAKYGLLDLEDVVEPYEMTLNTMKSSEIKCWSEKVICQLQNVSDLERDEYTFLAGEKYRRFLLPEIKNYKIPLKGLPIGKQLQNLKKIVSED